MFKKLRKQPKDVNEWTKYDEKVLQAVEAGDHEKLQTTLTKKGTSATKLDAEGKSAFHLAAKLGQYPCLEILLQLGADVNVVDKKGCTALHCASKSGHFNCIQRLLQLHADATIFNIQGETALQLAVASNHSDCCKLLLLGGAPVGTKDKDGKTPLMVAAENGDADLCRELIERGAVVNEQDKLLQTALILSCKKGHKEVIDLLVKRGANVTIKDNTGHDAAFYAENCTEDAVKELLNSAPSVATWDIKNEEDDNEVKPDVVDFIDRFDMTDRGESPVPNSLPIFTSKHLQNGDGRDMDSLNDSQFSHHSTQSATERELKELEEENEVLHEELSTMNISLSKSQEKVKMLERLLEEQQKNGKNSENTEELVLELRDQLANEQQQKISTREEIAELKARLAAFEAAEDMDEEADKDDSCGDSDEDLFDLPGTTPTLGKAHVIMPQKNNSDKLVMLTNQIASLKEENATLKMKNEKNSSGSNSPFHSPSRVPTEDYLRLKDTSDTRISELEGQVTLLQDELSQLENRSMVPVTELEEMREATIEETSHLNKIICDLKDERMEMDKRLAELMEENARVMAIYSHQHRGSNAPSVPVQQYQEVLDEKSELEEAISKHTEVLADQAMEIESLSRSLTEKDLENEDLHKLLTQEKEIGRKGVKEQLDMSELKNKTMRNKLQEQEVVIFDLKEKAESDKNIIDGLMKVRDRLEIKVNSLQSQIHDFEDDREKLEEVIMEHRQLEELVKKQELSIANHNEQHVKLEDLLKENWMLQDSVRTLEEKCKKLEEEVQRTKKTAMAEKNRIENNALFMKKLQGENDKLREAVTSYKLALERKTEEAERLVELQKENSELKEKVVQLKDSGTKTSPVKNQEEEESKEIKKMKEELSRLRNEEEIWRRQQHGSDKFIDEISLQKQMKKMELQMDDMLQHHESVIATYRSHLLSAVQGNMDPAVQNALQQIVQMRNTHEV
ncbi:ankycorbin-like [Anneissia japonica]|uniref:ankycorbin-like n=1 Tax=Anneissia japonica TaxID=1529436 RepID=UPI0014254E92|nr:ankycorbin-like [Anneissia japonica]